MVLCAITFVIMKRKTFEKQLGQSLCIDTDYGFGDSPFCIKELREFITNAESEGATHVKITGNSYDYGVDYVDIQPLKIETESDEAYAKRLAEEESKKQAAENVRIAKEKALYEELKLKYDS